ncbi:hypothetical protein GBA52_020529 [Prunus armeniaca]|nr:hypothetical protein GBA52_020529 [Prunus armeniaca]
MQNICSEGEAGVGDHDRERRKQDREGWVGLARGGGGGERAAMLVQGEGLLRFEEHPKTSVTKTWPQRAQISTDKFQQFIHLRASCHIQSQPGRIPQQIRPQHAVDLAAKL